MKKKKNSKNKEGNTKITFSTYFLIYLHHFFDTFIRLIKNRESAQLSRLRKKQYIENLENQVKKLTNDNAILHKHIETVQSQNMALQEEVIYLRNVANKQDSNPNMKARNTATAGVCLLLILFSFGLFFNQSQIHQSSPLALPSSSPQTYFFYFFYLILFYLHFKIIFFTIFTKIFH